jgi:RNA polymerase sigma-70 factor (sigma-E family)
MDLLNRGRARTEFERFAALHADALLRSAYLMAGDRGEAEDLVQECLLRLARKWPRVRSMEHQGAYARRVLFNLILDGGPQRARRRTELPESQATDGDGGEGRATAAVEARVDLVQALGGLPARQRAVLVLRYFADLPAGEVGLVLDCSPGTVKSSASRGLVRLREALDPAATPDDTADDTSPR